MARFLPSRFIRALVTSDANGYWRALFSPAPEATAQRVGNAQLDRAAYLVQSLGHCDSCHTPRAVTLQEKGLDELANGYLTGTELNGWNVPALRGMPHWRRKRWSSTWEAAATPRPR